MQTETHLYCPPIGITPQNTINEETQYKFRISENIGTNSYCSSYGDTVGYTAKVSTSAWIEGKMVDSNSMNSIPESQSSNRNSSNSKLNDQFKQRKKDLTMLLDLYEKEKQKGNMNKSLQFLEEYLHVAMKSIPNEEEIEKLRKITEKFIVKCNVVAMDLLTKQKNKQSCKTFLQKARNIIDLYGSIVFHDEDEKRVKLLVSTLNNCSVYYKECGELESSLESLREAQKHEKHFNASLELNFCAVLSQMGRHEEALEHGMEALRQLEIYKKLNHIKNNIATCNETLTVAFYNVAVEYEHLSQTLAAMDYYSKGFGLSLETLGADHTTTKRFKDSIEKVRSKNWFNKSLPSPDTHQKPSKQTTPSDTVRKFKTTQEMRVYDDCYEHSRNRKPHTSSGTLHRNVNNTIPTSKSLPIVPPSSNPGTSTSFRRAYKKTSPTGKSTVELTEGNLEIHNKLNNLHFYATEIQRVFRGYLTRKKIGQQKSIVASKKPVIDIDLMYGVYLKNVERIKEKKSFHKKQPKENTKKQSINDISAILKELEQVLSRE